MRADLLRDRLALHNSNFNQVKTRNSCNDLKLEIHDKIESTLCIMIIDKGSDITVINIGIIEKKNKQVKNIERNFFM